MGISLPLDYSVSGEAESLQRQPRCNAWGLLQIRRVELRVAPAEEVPAESGRWLKKCQPNLDVGNLDRHRATIHPLSDSVVIDSKRQ